MRSTIEGCGNDPRRLTTDRWSGHITPAPRLLVHCGHGWPGRVGRGVRSGRSLSRLPAEVWCGSLMACVLAGHRGVEWLEKGLFSSKKRCPPRRSADDRREEGGVGRIIIGVDPHKLSATIEVLDNRENVLAGGRFGTDRDGYRQILAAARRWPDRVWAVEGSNGIGRHVAQRLTADGETVLDVPAKLSARARVFSTGHGRKTDATDAHSIAVVAVRTPHLNQVALDDELVALRLLADRRDELAGARTRTVSRLHRLLLELIPGGAPRFLSAAQAKALLATVRPRDVAGRTRRQLAAELLADIVALDRKLKDSDRRLTEAVAATSSGLPDLYGIGPVGAARILGDVGNVARFRTKAHFASWTGTAPIDASSGQQQRHRLVPRREPAPEPSSAHHGDRSDPPRHRRTGLLPAQARRRQDAHGSPAVPETTALRRGLPAAHRRRHHRAGNGPGRTLGGDYKVQRGQPDPGS